MVCLRRQVCRVLSQEMHESRMAPATTPYITGGGRSRQCGGVDKYTPHLYISVGVKRVYSMRY